MLTSFNGHTIAYDEIGNPLTYYNGSAYTFTWEGRRLVEANTATKEMLFTYNDDGIRTSKTVDNVKHTYHLNGSQIVAEEWEDKLLVYLYDASGAPIGMMYRTTSYAINSFDVFWFEKNLQGDIVAVYNSAGTKVATYTYNDAWGNHSVSYTNGGGSTGAQYNPFRYRGYYYDTDLGMYYLQSRYYDPNTCRFINADVYISTGYGIIGNNMFAYCNNIPTCYSDPEGTDIMYDCDLDDDYDMEDDYWRYAGGGGGGGSTGALLGSASSSGHQQLYNKLDYVFGKATGNQHNIDRSTGLLRSLETIGINDTISGRLYMLNQFETIRMEVGLSQTSYSSLIYGSSGILNMVTHWVSGVLKTIFIYGHWGK